VEAARGTGRAQQQYASRNQLRREPAPGRHRPFCRSLHAGFAARWPAHQALYFGHVGDGNLHVSVDGKTVNGECEQVEELLYRIVGEMQGSVSAEHGIGLHKSLI
jgi:FAD/FMN-containing dehydrogenase